MGTERQWSGGRQAILDLEVNFHGTTVYKEFAENALREMRLRRGAIKDVRDGPL
jgi:hypothetical protein